MTDEGYYLHWISNPWLYTFSNSQFGYVYHPLYQLVNENIVLLRQANMLIMLGLSWILCAKLLRYTLHDDEASTDYPPSYLYGIAFVLATCVFGFFGCWWWIPTPSYNSLALEALLLTIIGLINLSMRKARVTDWVILGIGGWLAFMAKPTTAIALGLLSFLYVFILSTQVKSVKINRLLIALLIACSLTCLSAWVIDGSIYDFIMRLWRGVEMQRLLFNGDVFNFLPKFGLLSDNSIIPLLLFTMLTFLATTTSTLQPYYKFQAYYFFALLFICVLLCINYYVIPIKPNPWTADIFLALPLGSWLALMRMPHKTTLKFIILPSLFMLLPYAFAIGTNEDIWIVMLRTIFFWMLAIIAFLAQIKQPLFVRLRIIISVAVGGLLLTIALVQLGMEHPYRQTQSLRTQTKPLKIMSITGRRIGQLIVSNDDAHYMEELRRSVLHHGFSYGDSMIDLTGFYPTALYILGANPVGFPWVPTVFIGSTDVVVSILSQVSCTKLAKAWILTSINTTNRYDPVILEPHAMNQTSHRVIDGNFNAKYGVKHQVMKPKRSYKQSTLICEKMQTIQKKAQNNVIKILGNTKPSSINIINRSLTYINDHNLDETAKLLTDAILINPTNPHFYNNLCFTYALQKKYNDAMLACSNALRLAPLFQLAKNNLAWVTHEKDVQRYEHKPY